MKLAPPMLPPNWQEQTGSDGSTRVLMHRGNQGCGQALAWTSPFLCLLLLFSCGGFWAYGAMAWLAATVLALVWLIPTVWLLGATETWTVSASRFGLRVALTRFLTHQQVWRSSFLRVTGPEEGRWELLAAGDGENRSLFRTNDREEVLGLASFISEKTGWAIVYDQVGPVFHQTLDHVLRLRSTPRLRLLVESRTLLTPMARIPGKRRRALLLEMLRESEAEAPLLEGALRDPDVAVRMAAVDLLGALEDRSALPAIRTLLVDREPEVRWRAAAVLGQLRDTSAVQPLCEALRQVSALQPVAARALGLIGAPEAGPALLTLLRTMRERPGAATWEETALALGAIGCREAVPDLCAALSDPVFQFRGAAAQALGQIGDPQATPALCRALGDPEHRVAAHAAGALGRNRDPEALAALQQAASSPNPEVRVEVIRALTEFGGDDAIDVLTRALEDAAEDVRIGAARGLGAIAERSPVARLRLRSALPVLRRLAAPLTPERHDVKQACRSALQQIEASTEAIKGLPVPAEPAAPSADTLPRPAD